MSTLEPNSPIAEMTALLRGYMSGNVPLAKVVAAIRELPPGTSGDLAFALEEDVIPASEHLLDALIAALSESDRAV